MANAWWYALIRDQSLPVILVLIAIIIIWLITLQIRFARLKSRHDRLLRGSRRDTLEQNLANYSDQVIAAGEQIRTLGERCRELQERLDALSREMVTAPSIVRFNAFNDSGSDLSFAAAILNDEGDGMVLSSIYGRDESRTYGKPLKAGRSDYVLTKEEQKAVELTMSRRRR